MPLDVSPLNLEQAICFALETTAFVTALPPDEPPAPTGPGVLTRIEFRGGDYAGAIELLCPRGLGAMLAANLLGCAPEDSDAVDRADDALRELVNITCGALLRPAISNSTVVEMTVPTQTSVDLSVWATFVGGGATVLDAEGHPFAVRLL